MKEQLPFIYKTAKWKEAGSGSQLERDYLALALHAQVGEFSNLYKRFLLTNRLPSAQLFEDRLGDIGYYLAAIQLLVSKEPGTIDRTGPTETMLQSVHDLIASSTLLIRALHNGENIIDPLIECRSCWIEACRAFIFRPSAVLAANRQRVQHLLDQGELFGGR